jgi:hypothetical protein
MNSTEPHRIADVLPAPAGWRAVCSCGWKSRGDASKADAIERHADHRAAAAPRASLDYRTIIR